MIQNITRSLPAMCAKKISKDYAISFPAIKGVQAGREYYVTMCPLKLLPTMFQTTITDIPPELRAQRDMNKNRVSPTTRYLTENSDNYVFPSIAASIDSEVEFDTYGDDLIFRTSFAILLRSSVEESCNLSIR